MVSAVVQAMRAANVRSIGYIGFSDAWGDVVKQALDATVGAANIRILTDERYARADTSVTAQILKIITARPDAVMTGGSGTPGALPFLALRERGFRGPIYGTHALINPDFIRVGGAAVEGVLCPTGPVIVAEQLPDTSPVKRIGLEFRNVFQRVNNAPTTDAFSAYSFDAWLVFADAAKRALTSAQPGTPQFREALRAALFSTREVIGTHGVYSYTAESNSGVDERARVMVRLERGQWKLQA
jgi:branched-chain amino acid transport system substrate-binding protein